MRNDAKRTEAGEKGWWMKGGWIRCVCACVVVCAGTSADRTASLRPPLYVYVFLFTFIYVLYCMRSIYGNYLLHVDLRN